MRLHALFIMRKGEDFPELIECWDQYSIDSYPDGFREACQKALDACGDDVEAHRYATIFVDADRISGLFQAPHLDSAVSRSERRDLLPKDMP